MKAIDSYRGSNVKQSLPSRAPVSRHIWLNSKESWFGQEAASICGLITSRRQYLWRFAQFRAVSRNFPVRNNHKNLYICMRVSYVLAPCPGTWVLLRRSLHSPTDSEPQCAKPVGITATRSRRTGLDAQLRTRCVQQLAARRREQLKNVGVQWLRWLFTHVLRFNFNWLSYSALGSSLALGLTSIWGLAQINNWEFLLIIIY